MNIKTADLYDEFGEHLELVEPIFNTYGDKPVFSGEIVTLKVFEDNSLVRAALEGLGKGRVLVVDGGGSLRCALVGDKLAELAMHNGWEGIIVYGCIRDSEEINGMDIGIKALNTCPVKSIKRNEGQKNILVKFAGIQFIPGQYLYADADGVLISEKKLI